MSWNPLLPGAAVCICFKIDHNHCRDLVLSGQVKTLEDLKRLTKATSRCSLCAPYFEQIIAMYLKEAAQ